MNNSKAFWDCSKRCRNCVPVRSSTTTTKKSPACNSLVHCLCSMVSVDLRIKPFHFAQALNAEGTDPPYQMLSLLSTRKLSISLKWIFISYIWVVTCSDWILYRIIMHLLTPRKYLQHLNIHLKSNTLIIHLTAVWLLVNAQSGLWIYKSTGQFPWALQMGLGTFIKQWGSRWTAI